MKHPIKELELNLYENTTAMRFLVLKSNIDSIVPNTIVEFCDEHSLRMHSL